MADNPLKILLQGMLDEQTTTASINRQLEKIGKNLNVSIGVNDKNLSQLAKQVEQLQAKMNQAKMSTVSDGELNKIKSVQTEWEKIVQHHQKLGQVSYTKTLNPITKDVEKLNLTVEKADGTIQKLKYQLASLNNVKIQGKENGLVLASEQTLDKSAAIREKQLQSEQKLNKQIDDQNKKLAHQLEMFKQQSEINANNLTRRYDRKFDNTDLNNWLNTVSQLNTTTPNLSQEMDRLGMQFKKINSEVRSSQSHVVSFSEAFSTAMSRFPIWMAAATAFYAPLRALQDMTARLIEIDTLMVDIQRVMDVPDFRLTELLNEAVTTSDQLSSKLTDLLQITGEFARMGDYSNTELMDMSSTAQVLQNISDLDAKASVDTLTSAMLNFNIAASDSIQIAD
ncbi:phage tail tape measure protein [Metabacillus arenae]|uniref:Phage tail tape measure protein n=1 Tax=Metabacillus arenae TaxID=2771434 RepID=A0A926NJG1_9BACI|nr:phage tail tape measure protein [Metabacillus arenae]MBD1379227.1 phage tail tape measure protein [Metabacillus arenae]